MRSCLTPLPSSYMIPILKGIAIEREVVSIMEYSQCDCYREFQDPFDDCIYTKIPYEMIHWVP